MFIRVKTTPNSPRKSVQIVENIRKGDKVSQKIVRYVGIALDEQEEQKLRDLAKEYITKIAIERQKTDLQMTMLPITEDHVAATSKLGRPKKKDIADILPTSQVTLDDIIEEKRIIEGVHEVAGTLYDTLGYDKLLDNKNYNKILKDIVLSRLVDPQSKHKAKSNLLDKFDINHDLDKVYRMMDHVHDKIASIKSLTYQNTVALCPSQTDIIFFDVTTLYFESIATDDLRNFGYSKDCRFNTVQVVLALATNSDGLPVAYELFEGNKAEVRTLLTSIEEWKKCFAIGDVCFVGDRAMFSKENLNQLNAKNYKYVISCPLRKLGQNIQAELLNEDNYKVQYYDQEIVWLGEFKYEENNRRKKPSLLDEEEIPHEQRLIVTYSSKRARKDAKDRQRIIDKIKKNIGAEGSGDTKKLISNAGVKKYTTQEASISKIDQEKINQAASWDGMHGIISNIKNADERFNNALDLLARYRRLWVIEESFRINKHNLKMRPIYHFKPERIKAHVAICYITFALMRQLEYRVEGVHRTVSR
jgi:transposase